VKSKVQLGVEDFKALTESILKSARSLQGHYEIFIDAEQFPNRLASSSEAWGELFQHSYQHITQTYVSEHNLSTSFQAHLKRLDRKEAATLNNDLKLRVWTRLRGRLLEALCLLLTLETAKPTRRQTLNSIIRRCGPVEIEEEQTIRYVWTQPTLNETISGLKARPDLVVSTSSRDLGPDTIVRIVECKNVRQITSSMIRAEFGKAHDLKVSSYLVLTYYENSQSNILAAQSLGLDLSSVGLYGPQRLNLISGEVTVAEKVRKALVNSRKEKRFLYQLENSAQQTRRKLDIDKW
jgi:hypothetical protein